MVPELSPEGKTAGGGLSRLGLFPRRRNQASALCPLQTWLPVYYSSEGSTAEELLPAEMSQLSLSPLPVRSMDHKGHATETSRAQVAELQSVLNMESPMMAGPCPGPPGMGVGRSPLPGKGWTEIQPLGAARYPNDEELASQGGCANKAKLFDSFPSIMVLYKGGQYQGWSK
ncbi:unnamed protein product [Caretta caretta]